eukprot:gene4841-4997_t
MDKKLLAAGAINVPYEAFPVTEQTFDDLHNDPAYIALAELLSRRHPEIHRVNSYEEITLKPDHGVILKSGKIVITALMGGLPVLFGKWPRLIKQGHIGLAWNNSEPEFLAPGWHYLLSPVRRLKETVPLTQTLIQHGTICIVTIAPPYLALQAPG